MMQNADCVYRVHNLTFACKQVGLMGTSSVTVFGYKAVFKM